MDKVWKATRKEPVVTQPPVKASDEHGYSATINHNGRATIYKFDHYSSHRDFSLYLNSMAALDIWIARLVELKALAIEYFGEDWGK